MLSSESSHSNRAGDAPVPASGWPLAGRVALVTGGAKRLGRATALALAREGVHVVLHYRASEGEAEETVAAISALGVRAWGVQADLANAREAEGLLDRAIEEAGASVDILINNASTFPVSHLRDVTSEAIFAGLSINAVAPFLIARRVAAQGRTGAIVNFLDTRIVDADFDHAAYHLSKRMLFTFTRMMAAEFAPALRVNAVAPGLILPPAGQDVQYLERLASTNPLNTYGSVEAVTEAVLFLLRSDFITGQVIFVDGGRHLRGNMYGC